MTRPNQATRYLNPRKPRFAPANPAWYFAGKSVELVLGLLKRLRRGREIRRHTHLSRDIYQTYGDWEMEVYERGGRWTWVQGRMAMATFRDIRAANLAPVIAEIASLQQANPERPVRVLEVGCGNGTNLMILRDHFGDGVALTGVDIATERLRRGQAYWGARLDGVTLTEDSALTLATQGDGSADLVFSVHCLEQLPYHVTACVTAMARVSADRIVWVEPVWEFANTTQRLYALLGDQLRTLLPEVQASGLRIISTEPMGTLANPLNRSGVIIAARV